MKLVTMPKTRSAQSSKNVQPHDKIKEDYNEDSSENDIHSPRSGDRSRASVNEGSYLDISSRSDLGNRSDANVSTNSEVHKRSTRHNTSASSNSDDTDSVTKSKSSSLYPLLDEFSHDKSVEESPKSQDNFGDIPSKICFKEHTQIDSSIKILLIVCLIIGVLGVIFACFLFTQNQSKPVDDKTVSPFDRFIGHVGDLQQLFPSQNKRLWRTVKASSKHVLQDTNPNYPVVILMAAPTDSAHVSRCIANKIASSFESASELSPIITDAHEFQNLDPAAQKQVLDKKLILAFSRDKRKSFIIDNLQSLHAKAALLLHGYCDGDNAPHKDVMMILLLHINKKDVTDFTATAIEYFLEQQWSTDLELDKVKALLSRVANNIVTIEEEDDEDFRKTCH